MAELKCVGIELEQIRARLVINDSFTVETPFVKSFSVNKSRSSNVGTFSASIEVPANTNFGAPTGSSGLVKIYAGTKLNYITKGPIFTGIIRRMAPQPIVGKPNYFLISISGNDILSKLQNKKFSRRIATDGPGLFVTLNGSSGPRPTTQTWSIDKRIQSGASTFTSTKPDTSDREEHNSKIKYNDHKGTGQGAWLSGKASEVIPESGVGPGGGTGLNIHDHSTMTNQGGPAFGVYSIT